MTIRKREEERETLCQTETFLYHIYATNQFIKSWYLFQHLVSIINSNILLWKRFHHRRVYIIESLCFIPQDFDTTFITDGTDGQEELRQTTSLESIEFSVYGTFPHTFVLSRSRRYVHSLYRLKIILTDFRTMTECSFLVY